MNFSLRGKTALVTGARRGIGAAIAAGYAAAGAELILVARDAALEDTLEAIKANGAGEATVITADFADPAAVEAVATGLTRDRRIDILVNNAGTIRRAPAAETATSDWQHVLDVNLNSTWAITRPSAPRWPRGVAARSSRSPRCSASRAASWSRPTPRPSTRSPG